MLKQLAHLPRDSRDTLFMLAVMTWVVMPQVTHLPLWCSLLGAGVLIWRGWLAITVRPLPPRWALMALVCLTVAATLFTHKTLLGRDAGITLIVVLLAMKTLELRARRDAFVVFFLSFFLMLTNFFFSQSLLTAAAMLMALLGLLTALVNAHMPVGRPPLLLAARTAGGMALLGAPIMVVLFVLFPRMAPLWGVPGDAMSGAVVCQPPCRSARLPAWRWTTALPCGCVLRGHHPASPICIFGVRCCPLLTGATGSRCARTFPHACSLRPTCRRWAAR